MWKSSGPLSITMFGNFSSLKHQALLSQWLGPLPGLPFKGVQRKLQRDFQDQAALTGEVPCCPHLDFACSHSVRPGDITYTLSRQVGAVSTSSTRGTIEVSVLDLGWHGLTLHPGSLLISPLEQWEKSAEIKWITMVRLLNYQNLRHKEMTLFLL